MGAFVRPLFCVCMPVACQRWCVIESLVTLRALIRLVLAGSARVNTEIILGKETYATLTALLSFHWRMNAHVQLETLLLLEGLVAETAAIRRLSCVNTLMHLEMSQFVETFPTLATRVLLLPHASLPLLLLFHLKVFTHRLEEYSRTLWFWRGEGRMNRRKCGGSNSLSPNLCWALMGGSGG